MQYKEYHGEQISSLGFGLMRLPVIDDDQSKIDIEKVREMVHYAVDNGVNYFDTAYVYHNGFSEKAIGQIKAAAYNPDIHRIELYIWADNEKAHDHLERLEKTGEVPFSMACVRAGTPILTIDGYRPIEDIKVGDTVLTHLGKWHVFKG